MGQHRIKDSVNHRPNSTSAQRDSAPLICIVCHGPYALFVEGTRLAKTGIRITAKTNPEKAYVHQSPCLGDLVRNWAKYIVDDQGLKALGKKQ